MKILQVMSKRSYLLKTGQTTQYGSGSGADDGFFKKGIAKAYAILTTGQYSGTTNITLNAKTDAHSNNCVVDLNTRLMWSRYVSASVGAASDGLLAWTTNGSGEGIFAYAAAANAALLAGYSDWRVPNIYSLLSIVDYEAPTAAPNATAFPSFPVSTVWSATTAPNNTSNGLIQSFANGGATSTSKTTTGYCLLVRG